LVYDPNTRSFLPLAEILAIEQRLNDAANQTVKKKKRVAPAQNAGTHLAEGTVGGRPRGTAVDAMEAADPVVKPAQQSVPIPAPAPITIAIPPPATNPITTAPATTTKKKKKKVVMANDSDTSYMPNSSDNDSDFQPTTFNTRAGATLNKKPSIVREDREREEEEDTPRALKAETGTRTMSPTPLPRSSAGRGHGRGQGSAYPVLPHNQQQTRSTSQPVPVTPVTNGKGLAAKGSVRGDSVSPARSAHFAVTPESLAVKHQPPARSISPRKSALKNTSLERASTPIGDIPGSLGNSNRLSVSEASTAGSEDLTVPRKKAVRVSFDESNVAVGEAAQTTSTDSPILSSPQTKRSWLNFGRGKKKDASVVEDDDEIMKPRPALPSFGSVRERKNREPVEERQLVKPAEPVEPAGPTPVPLSPPLFTSPTGEVLENPLGQSNDHVVGSVLAQDAASKNAANISKSREPLPPQVLSVEGSGYQSDSDSTLSGLDTVDKSGGEKVRGLGVTSGPAVEQLGSGPTTPTEGLDGSKVNGEVPQISISQPTPTMEVVEKMKEWPDMPGGFPAGSSNSDSGSQADEVAPVIIEHHVTDPTPATVGIAEPYEGPRPGSPVVGDIVENSIQHPTIAEETEESDAVYSDAAEDLSDIEGDGFMSLNAVVESPVASAVPGLAISTPPDSPTTRQTKERAYKKSQLSRKSSEPDLDEGWDKAQEYWRGLSEDKKRQLEREAREDAEDSESTIEAKPAPKPKKKKKAVKPSPVQVIEQEPDRHERTYMIQPGSRAERDGYTPVIRSSMRAEPTSPASDTHIRKSMRGPGSMRASLREEQKVEPKRPVQKKNRPISMPTEAKADPIAVNRHVRALSAASAALAPAAAKRDMAPPVPTLRRRGSADSDSSFKRAKPAEVTTFRRSMRTSAEQERTQSPMRSSRFSLRSMSPTGSTKNRRPFNPAPPVAQGKAHGMRSSMRSSYDTGAPSLRGPPSRAKSPMRIPGFGRSSSAKPSKQNPVRPRASRFADSSDEEEARPSFRSRFVDSSDDDDELAPRAGGGFGRGTMRADQPVRSIPRQAGVEDGDSSDLPDSDDERSPSSHGMKLVKTRQNSNATKNQGATLASGSLRRSGSGRGALASPTTATNTTGPSRPTHSRRGSFMSILRRKKPDPSSKVRKADIESAARRDTPLERSRSDLQAMKRQESYNSTTNGTRPHTPKLQKRTNSSSWPLPLPDSPPKILGGEDGRPFTADAGDGVVGAEGANGVGEVGRPELGTRRFTATGLGDVDLSTVTAGKSGRKKKKFGALRRMFRLDD